MRFDVTRPGASCQHCTFVIASSSVTGRLPKMAASLACGASSSRIHVERLRRVLNHFGFLARPFLSEELPARSCFNGSLCRARTELHAEVMRARLCNRPNERTYLPAGSEVERVRRGLVGLEVAAHPAGLPQLALQALHRVGGREDATDLWRVREAASEALAPAFPEPGGWPGTARPSRLAAQVASTAPAATAAELLREPDVESLCCRLHGSSPRSDAMTFHATVGSHVRPPLFHSAPGDERFQSCAANAPVAARNTIVVPRFSTLSPRRVV